MERESVCRSGSLLMYQATAMPPGYGNVGGINSPMPLAPPGPRIIQSVERLANSVKAAADIANRLGSLADRVCGCTPEAVEKEREPMNPTNSMGMIEEQCETLAMLLRRAENHLRRLETL